MKKIVLSIIISNIFLGCLYSQSIKVLDISNYQPINDVVIIVNGKIVGTTNIKGLINLNVNNDDSITLKHISYETKSVVYNEIKDKNIVFLNPVCHHLNEFIVSANKFLYRLDKSSQVINLITDADIKFKNFQTTADAIQNECYGFVQKSQMGGGSPVLRGFEANKILLVVDGIRMNNAIYRGGHLQNIITVDPNALQKIEIVQGPGSLLFGSDALGGTIYLKTYDPQFNDTNKFVSKGEAMSRFSSANTEKTGHIKINIANNKFASLTTFTYSDFDDLRQGAIRNPFYGDWGKRTFYVERINNKDSIIPNTDVNIQKGSAYSQYDFMQKFLYKANEKLKILANIQYSNSSNVPRYDRLTQVQNNLPRFAEWYYGPQKRLLTYVKFSYYKPTKIYDQINIITAYQNIEESRHDRKFNNLWLNHRIEKLDIYSLNTDFFKKISKSYLAYGFDVYHEIVNSNANKENIETGEKQPLDTRYPDGGNKMDRFSMYVSNQIEVNSKVNIQAGLRFNFSSLESKFNDTTFYKFPFNKITQRNNAFTGNIGLVYYPLSTIKLNINYSSGYRTPNLDDLSKIFETKPGKVIMPNENLKPEYTHTFDLGLTLGTTSNYLFGTNAFYTLYNNAITVAPGKFNGQDSIIYEGQLSQVLQNVNKQEAYIYGFNAFTILKFNGFFAMNGSLTYTYGRIKTDTIDYPLDHIPPVYGKVSLIYLTKKLKSEFFVLFNGWKKKKDYNMFGEDNFDYATQYGMPAWYTINIILFYQLNRYIQFNIGMENILDANYRTFSSNISAPGRNFKAGLRITW